MAKRIGFIGAGNMATAIYSGILSHHLSDANDIFVSALHWDTLQEKARKFGFTAVKNNEEVIHNSDLVFLAVKPQYLAGVLEPLQPLIRREQAFISIVAGWTNDKLKQALGSNGRVLRVMPNTPLLVGQGMSCLCTEHDLTCEEFTYVQNVFEALGQVVMLEEKLIAAFSGLAGSGPAYVYMFIEAMADAGVKLGLPRALSYQLAAQTCLGSAEMVLKTGEHPGALKDAVCSPAGTTIEAVFALEQGGFRGTVIDAIDRCTKRFEQL